MRVWRLTHRIEVGYQVLLGMLVSGKTLSSGSESLELMAAEALALAGLRDKYTDGYIWWYIDIVQSWVSQVTTSSVPHLQNS